MDKYIFEKAAHLVTKLNPILNGVNINVRFVEYPKNKKFNKDDPKSLPYAHLSVKTTRKKTEYKYLVDVYMNPFQYFGDCVYEKSNTEVIKFFEAIDVPFNDTTLVIFNLIHELGHIALYENFKKDTASYEGILEMESINSQLLLQLFRNKSDIDFFNKYHFHEIHAEKFAYTQFPQVWKSLKNQNDRTK